MGIGREVARLRMTVSDNSEISEAGERGDSGDGGLYVEEVAVRSRKDDNETRVG
jgi:hypothetical protein